ncbi:choice-of-anchor Q domain-containing protein [Streptomyces coeruleorubidus]|uniref:Choice-of-anchor Q domain-containing protein n=1 Tax=Streptomyces coeruleorubidus TaxID=116188 RepID=A0ABZ0KMF6_STRC4|nr:MULTISPECIES: choice-of-anchor Q domain-containing protein [Streptomyces]WOT39073.1 choice-of-anchor Q domain-containing protein [Streptomyces coeruleorubidus]GGU41510.1 CSLREA domain-containing protein [Streptomyces bellus]
MKVSAIPAALAAVLLASAAHPATSAAAPGAADPTEFTVDTTSDAVDADPSDGRCRTASGTCSLRAAVMAANARPGSTITLPPGRYRLTIPPDPRLIIGDNPDPTTGDLNVDAPITIQGTGARSTVIDANRLDRVFRLRADTHMSDVTITGGRAVQRELPFTDTGGGGIANGRHLTLRRVAVTGNSAGYGGGIFNVPDSHLDLMESTVSGNAAGEAGGIRFDDSGTVTNSTIADNRVTDPGDRPGSLGGYGGGIDIRGLGTVRILNSTITRNSSTDGGGGINIAPAYLDSLPAPIPDIVDLPLGRMTLRNSVVAGNTVDGVPADCKKAFATIASQGNNLDGDGSCRLTAVGDLPSRAPLIGPLADNGGPTDTVALLPGSPALDAADGCPATDQRGVARPQGAACDIGAYERTP